MILSDVFKIGNSTVAGFLYYKMQEAEKAGIGVGYRVNLDEKYSISECKLIEVIGTLLNYAIETLTESDLPEKKIYFTIKQKENAVFVALAHTNILLDAGGVAKLWEKDYNDNGKGRKGALPRLKRTVNENNGEIIAYMKTINDMSHLCFKAVLPGKIKG